MRREDRRVGLRGLEHVELLDLARAVGHPLRLAETLAGKLAVGGAAGQVESRERRIEGLVIGGVELGLVHVHPDLGTLRVLRWTEMAVLGEGRCRNQCCPGGEHGSARECVSLHGVLPGIVVVALA